MYKEKHSQLTDEPLPPAFEHPESINQLNTILTYYKLPIINQEDSNTVKIKKIKEILSNSYINYGNDDLAEIEKNLAEKNRFKKLEEECDYWEIEIANLKHTRSRRFQDKSVEEIKKILVELEDRLTLKEDYEKCKDIVDGILNYDSQSLKYLGHIKENAFGAFVKRRVLDKLLGRNEEWALVLHYIVKNNTCSVEQLKNDLKIDRISILRVIYNYCAKGILEYDRLEDAVSLKCDQL